MVPHPIQFTEREPKNQTPHSGVFTVSNRLWLTAAKPGAPHRKTSRPQPGFVNRHNNCDKGRIMAGKLRPRFEFIRATCESARSGIKRKTACWRTFWSASWPTSSGRVSMRWLWPPASATSRVESSRNSAQSASSTSCFPPVAGWISVVAVSPGRPNTSHSAGVSGPLPPDPNKKLNEM